MRRPIGLDLNGWRDHGCRDWSAEDPDTRLETPLLLDGGSHAVVVEHGGWRVGGPQAILSPIGRGAGWSEIGALWKRRYLADHWQDIGHEPRPSFDGDMKAAAAALSHNASLRVLCIPDHNGFGEAAQKSLLSAFADRRIARPVLVWRSVALVLGLLDSGSLLEMWEGMRIACLIHGPAGFERQVLVLRRLTDHAETFAPERAGAGEVVCSTLSLSKLMSYAQAAVASANPAWDAEKTDAPRIPAELLFNEEPPSHGEIVRSVNGDWVKLRSPSDFPWQNIQAGADATSVQCDCTLVLTPLSARHHSVLETLLVPVLGGARPIFAGSGMAAQGALFAARRMERGIAPYLDRLDPIAMVVLRRGVPGFEDLIPADASVPGGREYVSKQLTGFVWSAGMKAVRFYLRKGKTEIQTWEAVIDVAPERDEGLVVELRQTAAQGWATLSMTATNWETLRKAPIRLEWGSLEPEPRTEDQILSALQGPRPAIPERIHYDAYIGLWERSTRGPGLATVLRRFKRGDPSSLAELRRAVSLSYVSNHAGRCFAVSTDGALPRGLTQHDESAFARTIEYLAEELLRNIHTSTLRFVDNDALLCLTWIFAACPAAIRDEVIIAFKAWLANGNHKLLQPRGASVVVRHALGRITAEGLTLNRLLPRLIALLPQTTVLAPLSSILSRPMATPAILARLDMDDALDRLRRVFVTMVHGRSFGVDYMYAQMALGGLLRVREHYPWALMTARSATARAMADILEEAAKVLRTTSMNANRRKLATTKALLEYLATNGGRPDILTLIQDSDDSPQ